MYYLILHIHCFYIKSIFFFNLTAIGDLDDFGSLLEIPYKVYGPEIDKLLTKSLDKKSIV